MEINTLKTTVWGYCVPKNIIQILHVRMKMDIHPPSQIENFGTNCNCINHLLPNYFRCFQRNGKAKKVIGYSNKLLKTTRFYKKRKKAVA